MARCPHANVEFAEETVAWRTFTFRGGALVDDRATDSRPTGMVSALCLDCGRLVRKRFAGRLPRWAWRYWERLVEGNA